jgi:hypothetical protein
MPNYQPTCRAVIQSTGRNTAVEVLCMQNGHGIGPVDLLTYTAVHLFGVKSDLGYKSSFLVDFPRERWLANF